MADAAGPADAADRAPTTDGADRADAVDAAGLTGPAGVADPAAPDNEAPLHERSVHWLADYVYGTISTLVAIAGLTFETNPGELTTAGVVVVGAVAIWFGHSLSRVVITRSWQHLQLKPQDVLRELRGSWSIVTAAIPATIVFILAGLHLWSVKTAFSIAEGVGVLALAAVGIGTTGGGGRSRIRRILYVAGLVSVGVMIVLFELLVHLL
jgi:hypothetical protein